MSSETKWTNGEWKVVSRHGEGCAVIRVGSVIEVAEFMSEADAQLLVGAPKLYEALAALTDWTDWSFPQVEKYAEEFARETGMLAPFKDAGAVANEAEELHASRSEEWRAWLARKRAALITVARTAQSSAAPSVAPVSEQAGPPSAEIWAAVWAARELGEVRDAAEAEHYTEDGDVIIERPSWERLLDALDKLPDWYADGPQMPPVSARDADLIRTLIAALRAYHAVGAGILGVPCVTDASTQAAAAIRAAKELGYV